MSTSNDHEPSKVEIAKAQGRALRGTIEQTLASGAPHFEEDDKQLLKFHGIYQQDDRDVRVDNKRLGLDKAWMLMIRLTLPGGALTARQWLDIDRLCDQYANGSIRLTTRQSIQFHGVLQGDLKPLIREINEALLTTLSACGDVERNVMATAAPMNTDAHREVQRVAREIARELRPRTGAYHEIWIDGEKVLSSDDQTEEPFYGETYLPRKFKTGVALDSDNSVDAFAYDCGLLGLTEGGRVTRYVLLAGGGMGLTHKKADTFARIATPIGTVAPQHAVEAVKTVASILRDFGNRSDRRHARLKYLLEEWGIDRFREVFQERVSWTLDPPAELPRLEHLDYLGLHDQGDGKRFYGVYVPNGRVRDGEGERFRTAFREIATRLEPSIRLTPMQSILFCDLEPAQIDELLSILKAHGVATVETLSNARRYSMACPALPTCGLALADAERILPSIIDTLEVEFRRLGIDETPLTIRMTGCPNGCARPYNADIGFVGRKPDVYHIFVGGGLAGDRMADLFAADVPVEGIVGAHSPLLQRYRDHAAAGESRGDYYQRTMSGAPGASTRERRTIVTGDEEATRDHFVRLSVNGNGAGS